MLFIENVGNLVCPAEFDLGKDVIDLLPYTDFDLAAFRQDLKALNPNLMVITLSARTGEGLEEWFLWLKQLVASKKEKTSPCGATA